MGIAPAETQTMVEVLAEATVGAIAGTGVQVHSGSRLNAKTEWYREELNLLTRLICHQTGLPEDPERRAFISTRY